MVRSIGADRVIDYTREDFTRDGQHYDLIFDVAGSHPLSDCRRLLNPNGTLVLAGQSSREKPSILPFLLTPVVSRLLKRTQRTRRRTRVDSTRIGLGEDGHMGTIDGMAIENA